jgi:hypothetical protein
MKLQRYGKDGQPRNEFKDSDRDTHEAYVRRTGDRTWRPIKTIRKEQPVKFVPVKQPKTTITDGVNTSTNTTK